MYPEAMDKSGIRVVSAEEARSEGLREGVEASAELGAFVVTMWWPRGATGGPQELVIRPAEDHGDPGEISRGITTGTLRNVPLTEVTDSIRDLLKQVESTFGNEADDAIKGIIRTIEDLPNPGRAGRSEEFYLWVSVAYAHVARWGDKPIQELADRTGVSPASVKTWVRAARNAGLLSEASESRPGGQLTPKARRMLEAD